MKLNRNRPTMHPTKRGHRAHAHVHFKHQSKTPSKMAEILDEIEVKNNRKSFSKFSLINSLITLGLVVYLFSSIPKTIKVSEGLPDVRFPISTTTI